MNIEEVKKNLEMIREYNVRVTSIKRLSNEELNVMLKRELEELTDRLVYVRSCIDALKGSKIRQILILRYVDGYTFIEIAKTLKLSLQWTQELHRRGIDELSKIM